MKPRISMACGFAVILILAALLSPPYARAEEKKPPVTRYWMSVETHSMSMPGMEQMQGMPGMSSAFGPNRTLHLQLNSPKVLPPDPEATHDIPPGQNMGKTLPLLSPEHERAVERYTPEERGKEKFEKPKFRMLIYWGCSEEVRAGQPLVIDTEKMSPADFGKAFSGHTASRQSPPSERDGWIYAEWPNRKSSIKVPVDGSLIGGHFVHANYAPDIRFSIDRMHDFMAPVEFTSVHGALTESITFQWREIPTAIGYFAQAMAHNEKAGETIFWSSSEVKDSGFGLMDYLTPADVRKFIKEGVVMEPKTTSCAIPKGIFKDSSGGMLNFIAYGEEMNVVYPPKPADPTEPWNPVWAVKVRLKSTGMTMLGGEERRPREMRERQRQKYQEESPREQTQEQYREPERESETPPPPQEEGTMDKVKKLKGFFGF